MQGYFFHMAIMLKVYEQKYNIYMKGIKEIPLGWVYKLRETIKDGMV